MTDAVSHEKILAAEQLIMYDASGKATDSIEDALAIYIGTDSALELFFLVCSKILKEYPEKTYITNGLSRDTFTSGFYVWDSDRLCYVKICDNSLGALKALLEHDLKN